MANIHDHSVKRRHRQGNSNSNNNYGAPASRTDDDDVDDSFAGILGNWLRDLELEDEELED